MLATPLAAAERPQASKEHDNGDGFLSPVFGIARAALASKFDNAPLFVGQRAPWCPRSSGRAANVEEPEDPHARLDASIRREKDLEDARVVVEAELEDACRPAADVLTVLESELEHKHAALEEEHKRTTKLEGRLWHSSRWKSSHPLHGGAILSPGSRSACGR